MSKFKPTSEQAVLGKIGANLASLLAERGYSYRKFQAEHGVTSVTVCDIVKQHSVPTLPMLIKIANALKVRLSVLLGESDE